MYEDLKGEIWKPVKGWEDWYEVSNMGRMKSLPKPIQMPYGGVTMRKTRIMKQTPHNGYLTVGYGPKSDRATWYVHRVVAETFLGGEHPGMDVNHKNGNKHDNRLENLEWVTRQENVIHARDVLNSFNHVPVRQYTKDGTFVKEWRSLREAADGIGRSLQSLSIASSDLYPDNVTAGGYVWKRVKKGKRRKNGQ